MKDHHCNFRIINEDKYGIKEVCRECKRILTTPKASDGRIDNQKYLKEHTRDMAQPNGPTGKIFKKYYGEPKTGLTPDKLKRYD